MGGAHRVSLTVKGFGMRPMLAVLVTIAAAAPAWARADDTRPVFLPTRDVAIDYRTESNAGPGPGEVKFSFNTRARRIRVEGVGQPVYLLLDPTAARMMLVTPQTRSFMELPIDQNLVRMFQLDPKSTYERTGHDSVAGHDCDTWRITGQGLSQTACVTKDGVMLRATADDPGAPKLLAVAVRYGAQPDKLFAPPSGYSRVEPPGAPGTK